MAERRFSFFSEVPELINNSEGYFKLIYDPLMEDEGALNPGVIFNKSDLQYGSEFGSIYPGMIFKSGTTYYLVVIRKDCKPTRKLKSSRQIKLKRISQPEVKYFLEHREKKSLKNICREIEGIFA